MEIFTIVIIILVTSFGTYFIQKQRHKRRVNELLDMIQKLNVRNYKIPMKQDEYSILEDEIYKLFLQLVEERDMTRKLSEEQTKNLEDIAHQIKTPLTSMLFSIEILEEEENNLSINNLKSQIHRLSRLTDVLLKLSSLEANITKMKTDTIYLSEMIDYVLDILDGEIKENGIDMIINLENENIKGDFYWISEAIINILRNAIRISRDQSIVINATNNPIYTELTIEDEAGGIQPKDFKKIFQRFYKSPNSNGFGIGLSMAKTIVENNNGEINVANGEKGAIFSVKFYNVT